jgi:hypothetical protein
MRPQFKTIKSKVQQILTEYPQTRDNNAKLIFNFYLEHHDLKFQSHLSDFIMLLIQKQIPSIETLTRLSRQVQEQNIELRGEKWHQRKTVKTEIVKSDLGYGKH